MFQESVNSNHLKTTMRAIRSFQVNAIPKTSEVKFDTGYLIGLPDNNLANMSGLVGGMWWKIEFRRQPTRGGICSVTFLVYFLGRLLRKSIFVIENGTRILHRQKVPRHRHSMCCLLVILVLFHGGIRKNRT